MEKEKVKILESIFESYKELQERNNVDLIEFHTADGQKHGIGNPEAIKLLLDIAVIELERQLLIAEFGDIPEQLEHSHEYKAAMDMERAMNNLSFNPKRFAESIRYMHPTLQQTFFRTVKASILFMAAKENLWIDGRNQASHEMCRELAGIAKNSPLPFI